MLFTSVLRNSCICTHPCGSTDVTITLFSRREGQETPGGKKTCSAGKEGISTRLQACACWRMGRRRRRYLGGEASQGVSDGEGALGEGLELEDTHGAVPHHRLGVRQLLLEQLDGLGADVQSLSPAPSPLSAPSPNHVAPFQTLLKTLHRHISPPLCISCNSRHMLDRHLHWILSIAQALSDCLTSRALKKHCKLRNV